MYVQTSQSKNSGNLREKSQVLTKSVYCSPQYEFFNYAQKNVPHNLLIIAVIIIITIIINYDLFIYLILSVFLVD